MNDTLPLIPAPAALNPELLWPHSALIAPNNFIYKSLSNWSYNIAVGCNHGCRFCYVPQSSTGKMAPGLAQFGVKDPDAEWGQYLALRQWNEKPFRASLKRAEETAVPKLKRDGNRAVMLCTTTDPYQVVRHEDVPTRKLLQAHLDNNLIRRALEIIRDESTINVRILTRSPLARQDFDLMKTFGKRLLFGMSLPTLDGTLAKIYEPHAPAPHRRLETLRAAKEAGLHVYVAMAPTYPECDRDDIAATLDAIADLNPVTVFHEPINIRGDNVERIRLEGEKNGRRLNTEVFASTDAWAQYAMWQLQIVERLAQQSADFLGDRLHLWPDKSLERFADVSWLSHWWNRVSEWPA